MYFVAWIPIDLWFCPDDLEEEDAASARRPAPPTSAAAEADDDAEVGVIENGNSCWCCACSFQDPEETKGSY